jgi:hypothetical protein
VCEGRITAELDRDAATPESVMAAATNTAPSELSLSKDAEMIHEVTA